MQLDATMSGNIPYITNIPVYLATTAKGLKKGAVVCAGATGHASGYTLSVATSTAACKDAIGVLAIGAEEAYDSPDKGQGIKIDAKCFAVQSDYICDSGVATTYGGDWLPAILNEDAMYFAPMSTTQAAATASDTLVETITASVGTIVTIASVAQDVAGGWLYSHTTNSTGAATYSGSLRSINASIAAASAGLATAMNVSTDSSIVYMGRIGLTLTTINSTGQSLRSGGAAGAKVGVALDVMDNYVVHASAPMHPLRVWVDDGLDGLEDVTAYGKVKLIDFVNRAL